MDIVNVIKHIYHYRHQHHDFLTSRAYKYFHYRVLSVLYPSNKYCRPLVPVEISIIAFYPSFDPSMSKKIERNCYTFCPSFNPPMSKKIKGDSCNFLYSIFSILQPPLRNKTEGDSCNFLYNILSILQPSNEEENRGRSLQLFLQNFVHPWALQRVRKQRVIAATFSTAFCPSFGAPTSKKIEGDSYRFGKSHYAHYEGPMTSRLVTNLSFTTLSCFIQRAQ